MRKTSLLHRPLRVRVEEEQITLPSDRAAQASARIPMPRLCPSIRILVPSQKPLRPPAPAASWAVSKRSGRTIDDCQIWTESKHATKLVVSALARLRRTSFVNHPNFQHSALTARYSPGSKTSPSLRPGTSAEQRRKMSRLRASTSIAECHLWCPPPVGEIAYNRSQ